MSGYEKHLILRTGRRGRIEPIDCPFELPPSIIGGVFQPEARGKLDVTSSLITLDFKFDQLTGFGSMK